MPGLSWARASLQNAFRLQVFPFRKGECVDFCTFFHRTKAVVIHNWVSVFFFLKKRKTKAEFERF